MYKKCLMCGEEQPLDNFWAYDQSVDKRKHVGQQVYIKQCMQCISEILARKRPHTGKSTPQPRIFKAGVIEVYATNDGISNRSLSLLFSIGIGTVSNYITDYHGYSGPPVIFTIDATN